jgi:hypothetical protein
VVSLQVSNAILAAFIALSASCVEPNDMIEKKHFYINGKWVSPAKTNDYEVINPSSEEAFAIISLGSAEDADKAIKAARIAFEPQPFHPIFFYKFHQTFQAKLIFSLLWFLSRSQTQFSLLLLLYLHLALSLMI